MLRRQLVALASAGLIAVAFSMPAVTSAKDHSSDAVQPRTIATFTGTDPFAESMAADRDGNLLVSVSTGNDTDGWFGQIMKITPGGAMSTFGPEFPAYLVTGLAFDEAGYLYAGLWDIDGGLGVLRFAPNGSMEQVATLPIDDSGAFHMVNGLAFHDGFLYAGDVAGAIWRFVPQAGTNVTLETPWLADQLLEPTGEGLGVNGITFRGDVLLAVNSTAGTVLRAQLGRDGSPGRLSVVASDPSLVTADGITLDTDGGLWVTVNATEANPNGSIVRVGRSGTLETLALDPASLSYPTQAVFDRTHGMNGTLYVANGYPANVIAFDVGPHGQAVP